MKQNKDRPSLPRIKFRENPDMDFPEPVKIKPYSKRKFWSPFPEKGGKTKKTGTRFYRRQLRKIKRYMKL